MTCNVFGGMLNLAQLNSTQVTVLMKIVNVNIVFSLF